jgi:Yip1-like protein
MLDFVFDPIQFFRARPQETLSWRRALVAPLLCVVLHAAAYSLLTHKTIGTALAILPPPEEATEAAFSFLKTTSVAFPFLSALAYLSIWLVATAMLVCIDILGRDSAHGTHLLKLTGLAYYSLVPYLLMTLTLAVLFQAPEASEVALGDDPAQTARNLRAAIQSTPTISIIRHFGYIFHAWLIALFVSAYRACSPGGTAASVAIAVFLYSVFFVAYTLFG